MTIILRTNCNAQTYGGGINQYADFRFTSAIFSLDAEYLVSVEDCDQNELMMIYLGNQWGKIAILII